MFVKTILNRMRTLAAISSAACLVLLSACSSSNSKADEERKEYIIPEMTLKSLKIDTVKKAKLVNAVTLTGQVDFNQDKVVNIFPLISGAIQDIKVVLGDYVEKGQVLGVVRSPEMAQYSSDVLNAQTNLAQAQENFNKTLDLQHEPIPFRLLLLCNRPKPKSSVRKEC